MATVTPAAVRAIGTGLVLGTVLALTSCLGELASPRGAVGEATIDLRGLRGMNQAASDTGDDVRSARFAILAVAGTSKREVASHLFTSNDLNVADTDSGTIFRMSFPYNTADDRFEVLGYGFGAQGDTLYRVGPAPFSMKSAAIQAGQAVVSVVVPPVYVGPGASAVRILISPRPVLTEEGKTTVVSATLLDAGGNALSSPAIRIEWTAFDGSVAFFPDRRLGIVRGGTRAGSTTIMARFDPLNLIDTVRVTNTVRPALLQVDQGGDHQTARVNTVLPSPIVVRVISAGGFGIPGIPVAFVVTQGGGTVSAGTRTTDAIGIASVNWTLGPMVGLQQMTVSVAGLPALTLSANATAAATSSQSTVSVLPTAIQSGGEEATVTATLRDAAGGPVAYTEVTFSGPAAATFSPTTATTNANGVASTRVRASASGTMTISVTVGGQAVGGTTLAVGTRSGTPASISVVSGNNQSVRIGQNFPQSLTIVVRDAAGAPVAGALVDWLSASGDGRKVTDANGQSSMPYLLPANWTGPSGIVTVTVTGTTLTATFVFFVIP